VCSSMLGRALPHIATLTWMRARAFALLGLSAAWGAEVAPERIEPLMRELAGDLCARYMASRSDGWDWFEDAMTYDNARLCEAVLRAGTVLGDATCVEIGLASLGFLESATFEGTRFVPIGNDGWYRRGGVRARYEQQPLEAAAMVDAELAAYSATNNDEHMQRAEDAFSWYLGRNDLGEALTRAGGCCDGLSERALNANMGAESTLAYLSSAFTLAEAQAASVSKSQGDARRNRRPERRPA
jgi:hypothetical protein